MHEEIIELILGGDLKEICAFRMAVQDIRAGRYQSAAARIRQDLDKVTSRAEQELFRKFIDRQGV